MSQYPQPGSEGAWQPYSQAQPLVPVRTNSMAVTSLVLGILSLVMCPLLGVVALVLGISARRNIAASAGREAGDGLAVAGIITGALGTVFMLVGMGLLLVLMLGSTADTAALEALGAGL